MSITTSCTQPLHSRFTPNPTHTALFVPLSGIHKQYFRSLILPHQPLSGIGVCW